MLLDLDVSGGPESGKHAAFPGPVVTIGRGPKNDLVLQDGLVSQYHGELVRQAQGLVYRDLRSRHGTLVRLDHVTVNLHNRERTQEIALADGAQLILGETVIRVRLRESVPTPLDVMRVGAMAAPLSDERLTIQPHQALETVTRRLSTQDPRLAGIFSLSRSLNAASEPGEILERLVTATFEAFPAANFFAITPFSKPDPESPGETLEPLHPLVSRHRSGPSGELIEAAPILSKSLLQRVARSRESVLFARDDSPVDPSQSIIQARITACMAAPLIGERGLIGVMQADTRGLGGLFSPEDLDLFAVMASYAAFAIERTRLNEAIVRMFDGFVRASVTAIEARDPTTAGHSERVARLTDYLADAVDGCQGGPYGARTFTPEERTELRYAALLHDFGKIGVPEAVLVKAERLYPGHRAALEERLETYRHARAMEIYQRELRGLVERKAAPDPRIMATIAGELERIEAEVAELRRDLLENQRLETIPDEVRRRFEAIARREFLDLSGASRPLVTADELLHLNIPRGTLTNVEWEQIRAHASISRHYLAQIPWSDGLRNVPCIAGLHHERLNGSGYPDGLTASFIPVQARILMICDVFDALTAADRPYRRAVSFESAVDTLQEEARRGLLDPDLVDLFQSRVLPQVRSTHAS